MDTAKVKFHQGLTEFKKGHYGEAFALFTEATQWDPEFADAFYHLGIIYEYQEDFDLATRYFEMAVGVNENHFGAKARLALVKDTTDSAESNVKPLTETQFFQRLREDKSESAQNLLEAIETSGIVTKFEIKDLTLQRYYGIAVKFVLLLLPSLFVGLFVGSMLNALGFLDFLPTFLIVTTIIFLLQVIEKYR